MGLVPPTRSIRREHHSPLFKRCTGRNSNVIEAGSCEWTTQRVAIDFAKHINAVSCNIQKLARQIVLLRRQLSFSSTQFVRAVLHKLERAPSTAWPLMAFRQLAKLTNRAVRLDTLLMVAQPEWLIEQCIFLRDEDSDVFRDYVEEIIAIIFTDGYDASAKASMRQLMTSLFSTEDDLGHVSFVLHDPSKLRFLTAEERRGFAMTLLDRMACSSEVDLTTAKICAVQNPPKDTPSQEALWAMARWFGEFGNTRWPLFFNYALDHATGKEPCNYTYIFCIYGAACRMLSESDQGPVRSMVILDTIKQRLADECAAVPQGKKIEPLCKAAIMLALVQIALHYLGESLGLRYPKWFQLTFVDPDTRVILSKRSGQALLQTLHDMVLHEAPAVLQMHAKILANVDDDVLLLAPQYVAAAKMRLLELGLDHSLRQYPTSIALVRTTSPAAPPQSTENAIVELLTSYKQTGTIPRKLWEDSIFRARWFKVTFLPALLSWKPSQATNKEEPSPFVLAETKDELITALKEKGKIPESIYRDYLSKAHAK